MGHNPIFTWPGPCQVSIPYKGQNNQEPCQLLKGYNVGLFSSFTALYISICQVLDIIRVFLLPILGDTFRPVSPILREAKSSSIDCQFSLKGNSL